MRALLLLLAVVVVSGCRFDSALPPGTEVSCASKADCLTGEVCDLRAQRCVREGSLDTTPPDVAQGSITVSLSPAPGASVTQPDALTTGGTAVLRFSVTEPLGVLPVLTFDPSLSCALVEAAQQSFGFACTLAAGTPREESVAGFSVDLEDLAGNRATVPLPVAVPVDTLAPAAPAVDTPGAVLFRRAPYGDLDGGAPSFVVLGAPGAVTAATTVDVLVGSRTVGSGAVAGDGSFRVELLAVNTPFVSVRASDGAGNASTPVRVRDGEWVVTPGGRVPGQPVPNPHRLATWGVMGPALPQGLVAEVGAVDGLAVEDGVGVSVKGVATWRPLSTVGQRPVGGPGLLASDDARGRLVAMGYFSSLAELDDLGWHPVTPTDPEGDGNPGPARRAASTWDPSTGLTLSFANSTEIPSRLWGWNGRSWKRLADGPPTRREPVFVYDGHRVLLVGGSTVDGGVLDDVWEYKDTHWQVLDAGPVVPPARGGAAAARDPQSGVVWIFSGRDGDGGLHGDLWRWDGVGFTQVSAPGPAPRESAAMACDRAGTCWLYGGRLADGGLTDELWAWSGSAWALASTDAGPPASDQVVFAHQPTTGDTVLLSNGLTTSPFTTWLWNGTAWRKDPRERATPASTNNVYASFGCGYPNGPCALWSGTDTWVLDATGWTDAGQVAASPFGLMAVAYDARRGSFLRVGFEQDAGLTPLAWYSLPLDGGTNGALGNWPPVALDELAAAAGSEGPFSCTWSGDVFALDGGLKPIALGAVANSCVCAAVVPGDGGVLFAENNVTQLVGGAFVPWPTPPARLSGLAYEPRSSRLLAFGSSGLDYFTLADGGWQPVPVRDLAGLGLPSPLFPGHLGGRMIAFQPPSQLWQLEWAEARPGLQWSVLWADAQLPDDAVLTAVSARARAGGLGEVGGAQSQGALVRAFVAGRWIDGSSNGAGPAAPASATLQFTAGTALRELREGGPTVELAIVPAGPNGAGQAEVQVDAAELVIAYRLP